MVMSKPASKKTDILPVFSVLLVEDNLAHAELITRSFEATNDIALTVVHNLADARKSLEIKTPDLVISDYRLPDGSGAELIFQLKNLSNTPIILMTSYGDETVAVNAMKAGAADYIVKSDVTMLQLPEIAQRVLREWQLIKEAQLAQQQQKRLTAILEATPDLICMADQHGYLTYMNQAGRNMLGLDQDEEIGALRLADFHSDEDQLTIDNEGIPAAIRDGLWTQETTFMNKKGEPVLTSQVLITHHSAQGEVEFFSTVARDIRYIRSVEDKIHNMAYYDTLTGLPNRNELLKHLDIEIARANRQQTRSALLFIDLDNFKYVNDSLGHPVGDLVLVEMAQRLLSTTRKDDTLARIGGDEFVLVLANLDQHSMSALEQAREVSRKLNQHIAEDLEVGGMTFNITASIGVSLISEGVEDAHELLRFADTAMYEAKKSGKNQYEVFHQDMGRSVSRMLKMEQKMRRACSNGSFLMYYQPKVCTQSGAITGAEALLRCRDAQDGLLAPNEFLDVLESSGMINEVGEWVLQNCFEQLAAWISRGIWNPQHRLSINISARQFQDKKFNEKVFGLIEKTSVPFECIDFEVTEHSLIYDIHDAIERMNQLIASGISFSLDDFGTGYSSMSYLKLLPVSTIKIDRSFIRDITEDKSDEALVTSIITISKNLGMSVVAEGIETEQQKSLLQDFNCDFLQGYYFSKPVAVEPFEIMLSSAMQRETVN